MSIIDAFDNTSKPLVDIGAFYGEKKFFADVCIVSFSKHVLDMFLQKYNGKSIGHSGTANGHIEIYLFEVNGKKLLFYMSPIGSAVAATVMYEAHHVSGATKFIVYGSCGVLDNAKCSGRLIVPSCSYRDEGLSYHYMAPSDYVKIKNCDRVAEIFKKHNFPYVVGKSWTTDAIYMETQNKAQQRKNDGCISVEMESAGLQALCDYCGFELYTFFFPADLLDGELWDKANLGGETEHDIQKETFDIALTIATEI
mgnify:CR=1 FL=1